ncbi:MAG TPA: hypothetical protein VKF80_05435 [Candidatus Eisenbacteria bacterium]|nr:hypothetical protein [Candidatus Eisenbacteria bacterium]
MKRRILLGAIISLPLVIAAPSAMAQVNNSQTCQADLDDWGDAPECIPAYPSGVIGHFPTCATFCDAGDQTFPPGCVPPGSPPGPTGFVHHVTPVGALHFWLGCYLDATGLSGIDSELDGKVNTPATGFSSCLTGMPTDCVESAFGGAMLFDQDECYTDANDHGVAGPVTFPSCSNFSLPYTAASCVPVAAYLNICVDWNQDGDWNDVVTCPGPGGATVCAPEWAVVNAPITLAIGCNAMVSPLFATGPNVGPTWFRISLTALPVTDDYPWDGSALFNGGVYLSGETEDYPAMIEHPVPDLPKTWGGVKASYR